MDYCWNAYSDCEFEHTNVYGRVSGTGAITSPDFRSFGLSCYLKGSVLLDRKWTTIWSIISWLQLNNVALQMRFKLICSSLETRQGSQRIRAAWWRRERGWERGEAAEWDKQLRTGRRTEEEKTLSLIKRWLSFNQRWPGFVWRRKSESENRHEDDNNDNDNEEEKKEDGLCNEASRGKHFVCTYIVNKAAILQRVVPTLQLIAWFQHSTVPCGAQCVFEFAKSQTGWTNSGVS